MQTVFEGHWSPKLSINDNTLVAVGILHPSERRRTVFVLYPESGQQSKAVIPRPLEAKEDHPDDLSRP